MREFNERHKPTGIMTNQPDGADRDRPLASTVVCDRDDCRKRAQQWVAAATNEPASYRPFRAKGGAR